MPKRICAQCGVSGLLVLLALVGCRRPGPTPVAPVVPPVAAGPASAPPVTTVPGTPATRTPVRDALNDLLKSEAGQAVFPKGTRLRRVSVAKGVATVDFSSEFNALANMGDTAESQVQHILRDTLASFPGVEKMRVTVEGKRFESEATDWNTPFPVREDSSQGASASEERP